MQTKLIIYLHSENLLKPSWIMVDADLRSIVQVVSGDPALLPQNATEVIVVVPAEDVLLTTVTLPKMSNARLLQALPFALEEQLIDDVENMHFASTSLQGFQVVAVVLHEKMQQWLVLLRTWHLEVDQLISAAFILPAESGVWHVIIDEMVLFGGENFQSAICEPESFPTLLKSALVAASLRPSLVHIHNYTQQTVVGLLDIEVPCQESFCLPDNKWLDFSMNLLNAPTLNLLQARHANKKSRSMPLKRLKQLAVGLLASVTVLFFLSPLVSYVMLEGRVSHIEDKIAQIYKHHFPNATLVVAPALRMQEKLQDFSAHHEQDKLLLLLGDVSKNLASANVKLKQFEFKDEHLTLTLSATASDNITAFVAAMQQKGFAVKQQNAVMLSGRINAVVVI